MKKVTNHVPGPFPPSSSTNDRVEAEGEYGSGVNGDGSPRCRKWKGKERAIGPIEDDDVVPMVVSPTKSPFPKLVEAQRFVTPRSVGTQLGAESSPLTSQFGDGGDLGLADLDVRDDAEGDGDELVPLSLTGEVRLAFCSVERLQLMRPVSCITGYSLICDLRQEGLRSNFSWPSSCLRQRPRAVGSP